MNKRVLARRLERVARKKAILQSLVDIGAVDQAQADKDMQDYLKKHLAFIYRKNGKTN